MTSTKSRSSTLSSERRRLTVEFLWLAGSTAAFQASRILTGVVAAGALPPAEFAEWGIALAILAYSVYFNLGVASGMNRELPQSIGAGDAARSERIAAAGLVGTVAACVFASVAVASIALLASLDLLVVGILAASAGVQQFYLHAQTMLRSRLRFNRASLQQTVLAVAFPSVALPLLPLMGIAALVVAQLVSFAVGATFSDRWRLRWSPPLARELRRLVLVGLPIMVAGLLFAVLTTLDRWAVLVLLGDEATGLYTLAALLSSSALLVSLVLAQQFYPRMAHAIGRGEPSSSVFSMAFRQGVIATAIVAPVCAALVIGAPLVIDEVLPAYAASVPALQVLSIGFILLVASSGFGNYLVVMRQPMAYVATLICAAVIEMLVAVLLQDFGLIGIATAAAAAYMSLLIGTLALALVIRR